MCGTSDYPNHGPRRLYVVVNDVGLILAKKKWKEWRGGYFSVLGQGELQEEDWKVNLKC